MLVPIQVGTSCMSSPCKINLGKTFLQISHIRNIPLTRILARVFVYLPPFISQILALNYWTVLIFILIYFEWLDTENQQYPSIQIPLLFSICVTAQAAQTHFTRKGCKDRWLVTFVLDTAVSRYRRPLKIRVHHGCKGGNDPLTRLLRTENCLNTLVGLFIFNLKFCSQQE